MQIRASVASLLTTTLCLAAFGCSAKTAPNAKAAASAAPPAAAPTTPPGKERVPTLAVGSTAPDFAMRDVDGKPVALTDTKGKVVLLDFWAPWKQSSIAQLAHVEQLAEKYRDQNLVVLASCTRSNPAAFDNWVHAHQKEFPQIRFAFDPRGTGDNPASHEFYQVTDFPEQFVISTAGKVVAKVGGYREGEVLTDAALAQAGLPVDAAIIQQAAQDRAKRDALLKSKAAKKG